MEQISQKKAALFVIVTAVVCSVATFAATATIVGESKFKAGVEAGMGDLKEGMVGEIYEVKSVGLKDGKAYELEGSYGYSINGQRVTQSIPADAKAGDSVACLRPSSGIQIVSRRQ